jgi:hypothetical protein
MLLYTGTVPSESTENSRKKLFDKENASALVTTYWVILYRTLYTVKVGVFFTIWALWVSKDADFYAGFKNIN